MPTYNKITLNGTTLIDLSTDTVAVADDIASGKVGHLNTGATATGTHSGIGEVIFSGSLSITNNTNIWQYLGIDSAYSNSFYIIVLQDLYVSNKKMDYASEYCLFFDEEYIDRPPQLLVSDGNDDYQYYIIPLVFQFDNGAYITSIDSDSLSAIITKIIKVQKA